MDQLPAGHVIEMKVNKETNHGYLLSNEKGEAFLPFDHTEHQLKTGESIYVFLYRTDKRELLATTYIPEIQLGQYGWSEVVKVLPIGAFVNIGIPKDVLVPADQLPALKSVWPKAGNQLFIKLDTDKQGRLLGVLAKEDIILEELELAPEEMHNQTVNAIVYLTRREGAACITDDGYRGFIHHTEMKDEPRLGDRVNARVIHVKEDGTLNLSLLPYKKESMQEDAQMILEHLQEHGGVIPFSDKSDPEDIRGTFQISKAAFKRALGRLMKEGKIEQREGSTYLK